MTTLKDIAVVGIALRFPKGIDTLDKFWRLLSDGVCAISEIPASRWPTDLYQDSIKSVPGRSVTFKAGVLDNIKDFDASFFGISPKEAEWLDPQQRLLLEVTQECIEDAGMKVSDFKGSDCGVYTGISSLDYGLQAPKDLASISAYTMTGNTLSIASNRISYVFDLHGPSVSMDTACSSSLVSLHHACQAIRNCEVPCAIVAGAHLLQDPYSFVGFSKASMLSPTGTCHPFAEDANGYVRSEGVAVLLLKPLDDAVRDNNRIHAVIKASGVNTDGSRKNGLTIPSIAAQKELMEKVLKQSGLSASDIDYVEAHGTGTPVGDPIEAKSISSVYAVNRPNNQILPISSAKGNLGHMEPMSGLASFIKAVLCVKKGYIPPIPFAFKENPNIDFAELKLKCAPKGFSIGEKNIRSAGVNSFGFGGANAHVIVQSYRIQSRKDDKVCSDDLCDSNCEIQDDNKSFDAKNRNAKPYYLFVSAKSKNSLKNLCLKHIEFIEALYKSDSCIHNELIESSELKKDSVIKNRDTKISSGNGEDSFLEKEDRLLRAYTYKTFLSRDVYACRAVFSASNKENLIAKLKSYAEDSVLSKVSDGSSSFAYAEIQNDFRKIAFVFNGNGSQYLGMGVNLYNESPIFAECIDNLSDKIESYIGFSIKSCLSENNGSNDAHQAKNIIENTKFAQPLIFAIQIALCRFLESNGIVPKAVIGHSMGEIAAACVSSRLSIDEAIKVICVRSMLQDTTRGQGKMAAVSVSKKEFIDICKKNNIADVSVAAINSSDNITVSGNVESLISLRDYFAGKKVFFKILDVDYPFHSSYMDVIKDGVLSELKDIQPSVFAPKNLAKPSAAGTVNTVAVSSVISNEEICQNKEDIATRNDDAGCKSDVAFYSSVTGTKCADDFSLNNTYWWQNIRDEVNFYGGVKSLLEDGYDYLIEIGSNAILQRYLRDIAKESATKNISSFIPKISSTLLQNSDDLSRMMSVVMDCHLSSGALDKSCFFNGFGGKNIFLSEQKLLNSIDLPHYAWEKNLFEYRNSSEKAPERFRAAPLLGWKISSSEYAWENILEPSKNGLLRDHAVDGQYVVAAADYIEIVLEAVNSIFGRSEQQHSWFNIEHLDILCPITMAGNDCYKSVRTRISSNTRDFEILSRDYLSNDEWILNVKGRLYPASMANAIAHDANNADSRDEMNRTGVCADANSDLCASNLYSLDSREIYNLTDKLDLAYGPSFNQLDKVTIDARTKCLKVSLISPDDLKHATSSKEDDAGAEYIIHPGVVDASFQGLLVALVGNLLQDQNVAQAVNRGCVDFSCAELRTYLPVKFGNISIRRSVSHESSDFSNQSAISRPSYITGRLLNVTSRSVLAEFRIFSADDECIGLLQNCRFNALPKADNKKEPEFAVSSWHYEQRPVHHDLLSVIDAREFSPSNLVESMSQADLEESFANQRKAWFENVLPLIENAVLYYGLSAIKINKDSIDKYVLSEDPKDFRHPLVKFIIDLLTEHGLAETDGKNKLNFISHSDESTGDEILRYAYGLCPEAVYDILPVYRFGNKLPQIVAGLLETNSIAGTSDAACVVQSVTDGCGLTAADSNISGANASECANNQNSMLQAGICRALSQLIAMLKNAVNHKHELRVLEFGSSGTVQAIVNREFHDCQEHIEFVSLESSEFAAFDLAIKDEKKKQIGNRLGQLNHNTFDLIIINEQMRYVKDYENALLNIDNLLSVGGLLAVIERNSDWSANIVNGLNNSWWSDNGSPILKASSYWESLLKTSSFNKTAVYSEPAAEGMQSGLYVILAQKDSECQNKISACNESGMRQEESAYNSCMRKGANTQSEISQKSDRLSVCADAVKKENCSGTVLFIVPNDCKTTNSSHQSFVHETINELIDAEGFCKLHATGFGKNNISSISSDVIFKALSGLNITSVAYQTKDGDAHQACSPEIVHDAVQVKQVLNANFGEASFKFNKAVFVAAPLEDAKTPYVLQKLADVARCVNELNADGKNVSLSVITFNADADSSSSAVRGMTRVAANELSSAEINSVNIETASMASLYAKDCSEVSSADEDDNANKHADASIEQSGVRCVDVIPIWRELLFSDGLDEVTIDLSDGNNIRRKTIIAEGMSDLLPAGNQQNSADLPCRPFSENDNDGMCGIGACRDFSAENDSENRLADIRADRAYYLDFSAPGRLRNLCWIEKELPTPEELGANQVIVDVKATGLNFRDIMMTMGLVPDDALENGFSGPFLGLEFSGTVAALGSGVTDFEVGDRVLGFGSSCFSNKLAVSDFSVARIPNEWSFESAATAPIVFFTAWYAISTLANMEKGESILIHGAAGGVGIAAIQIASFLGLKVYATAGSESKRDFLKMLGVERIYNSRELDFRTELLRDTEGQGVDAVLNCLSGEAMKESLSVLKPFGRFMELGKRDFVENTSLGLRYFKENISYFAIDVDQLFKFNPAKAKNIFKQVMDLFKNKEFTPLPYIAFRSADIVNAFKYMQQGNQIGKVVVTYDASKSTENTLESPFVAGSGREAFANNAGQMPVLADNKPESEKELLNTVFSSDDVWLITGGTRGFGWATAKYLLDRNIKQVVLVSRSGMTDSSVIQEASRYLSSNGESSNLGGAAARIIVKRCDVSDKNALVSLWRELANEKINVSGIIHAAAVFADCLLQDITLEHYQKAWNSKYIGAKNLDEVSRTFSSVKNFVVYSSISVAIGNIGQANYVATNSALEALVSRRLLQGYNSCCVEWGPISDVGYLQGNEQVKKSLELAIGAESLKSCEALAQLPRVIIRGGTQIIANLNWASIGDSVGKVPSRIYSLAQKSKNQYQSVRAGDLQSLIKDKSKSESVNIISDILVAEIADTMGFAADQINKEQNLQEIGLDSLMAMDLIVSIEKLTGIKLSVMTFQDNPNVNKLSYSIYQKIAGKDSESCDMPLGQSEVQDNASGVAESDGEILKQVLTTHVQNDDLEDLLANKENESND